MEELKERNRNRIIISIIILLITLVLVGLWFQKTLFHTEADIQADVYPKVLHIGDTLFYKDNTSFSATKDWSFGDGNVSVNDSGYYFYKKPGYYQVKLTLNGEYSKSFSIQVLDVAKDNQDDLATTIEGPIQAMQFENIVFRAITKKARLFSWKFGESGTIDSKEQLVIYSYKIPGDYIVSLYTDETEYPVTQKIKVLPSFKAVSDSISVEDLYKKIDDDFKYNLQQIANGNKFNHHYSYLLNKYLCKNENAVIKVNTSKINTFYYYCAGLQFDKNRNIQSVKVNFDEAMNCVTKVDIVQGE